MKEAKSNLCLGLGPSTVELWFLADSVGGQQIKLLKGNKGRNSTEWNRNETKTTKPSNKGIKIKKGLTWTTTVIYLKMKDRTQFCIRSSNIIV